MSLTTDFRTLVNDDAAPQKYTDTQLQVFLRTAILLLNAYGKKTFILSDYETPLVPASYYVIALRLAKIEFLENMLSLSSIGVRLVTQDVEIDRASLAGKLAKMLELAKSDADLLIRRLIGIGYGAFIGVAGSDILVDSNTAEII